jgi:glycerophosphoryl diester phosphodiesterase
MVTAEHWPYPRWIAHRGAGKLAPENTLAAFHIGAGYGYRMFECDVKLSSDDVPFLLHDNDLTRTTNAASALGPLASPVAGDYPWVTLSTLDAGAWHSAPFKCEPLPSLDEVAQFCLQHQYHLNIEIKPTPGTERNTGNVVARHAARLWQNATVPPLLTSFDVAALEGARDAAPDLPIQLPLGLLLENLWNGWLETALALGCVAVVCKYTLWDRSSITQAKSAGLRCLSYTVNDKRDAQRLFDLGTDGVITDRVDGFSPCLP